METWTRARTRWMLVPFVDVAQRIGLTPNTLTVTGIYPQHRGRRVDRLRLCLCRRRGDDSAGHAAGCAGWRTGAPHQPAEQIRRLFDSTLDRFAEGALLMGVAALFVRQSDITGVVVTFIALIGSLMVSYTRARAEGLGIECKVGCSAALAALLCWPSACCPPLSPR